MAVKMGRVRRVASWRPSKGVYVFFSTMAEKDDGRLRWLPKNNASRDDGPCVRALGLASWTITNGVFAFSFLFFYDSVR